jgi:hypothetical protein
LGERGYGNGMQRQSVVPVGIAAKVVGDLGGEQRDLLGRVCRARRMWGMERSSPPRRTTYSVSTSSVGALTITATS